jgi:hypothetical protein
MIIKFKVVEIERVYKVDFSITIYKYVNQLDDEYIKLMFDIIIKKYQLKEPIRREYEIFQI